MQVKYRYVITSSLDKKINFWKFTDFKEFSDKELEQLKNVYIGLHPLTSLVVIKDKQSKKTM